MASTRGRRAPGLLTRTRPRTNNPPIRTQSVSLLGRGRATIRRYLLISGTFAAGTVAVAILMAFLAVHYTSEPTSHETQAGPPVIVSSLPTFLQVAEAPNPRLSIEEALLQPPPPVVTIAALREEVLGNEIEMVEIASETPEPAPPASFVTLGSMHNVNVTFYDCLADGFCGAMYNGQKVHEGAAACSWNLPIGTTFYIAGDPTGRPYVCKDRGRLADTWVDIFWYDPADGYAWQSMVGRYGTIHITSMP